MPDQVVDRIPQRESIRGAAGNSHPSLPDPADLTAVSLGGIRIDLNKLTLLEKEPAILISGTAPDANQKKEESTQAKKTDAGVPAEQEQKLAEAKKITYWELKTASKEEQAKILESRKLTINSTSWVADGYNTYKTDADGKRIPHFSELFPGWEMPAE